MVEREQGRQTSINTMTQSETLDVVPLRQSMAYVTGSRHIKRMALDYNAFAQFKLSRYESFGHGRPSSNLGGNTWRDPTNSSNECIIGRLDHFTPVAN